MQAIYIYYKVLCTPSHPDITNNHPIHPTYSTTVLHQFEMAFFFFEIGCNVIYVKMLVIFKLRTARFRREATHGCQSLWWAQECHEKLRRRRYRNTTPQPQSSAPREVVHKEMVGYQPSPFPLPHQSSAQKPPTPIPHQCNKHKHNLHQNSTNTITTSCEWVRVQSWQKITK